MNREEAILCLKGIKNLGHDMFTEQKDFQECLDMAIKALEQEPCEDAVSREAVKKALRNRIGESISDCINAIPPVTPTRKKGKWKPYYVDTLLECSKCGRCFDTGFLPDAPKYCPNCGAEMEVENNG